MRQITQLSLLLINYSVSVEMVGKLRSMITIFFGVAVYPEAIFPHDKVGGKSAAVLHSRF